MIPPGKVLHVVLALIGLLVIAGSVGTATFFLAGSSTSRPTMRILISSIGRSSRYARLQFGGVPPIYRRRDYLTMRQR